MLNLIMALQFNKTEMHLNLEFYRFEASSFKSSLFYLYFCSSIFDLLYKMIDIKYTMIWIAQTHSQI